VGGRGKPWVENDGPFVMTASTAPRQTETADSEPRDATVTPLAVSPRKAAKYLDVGHDAIYQLLHEGRLRSVKLGRRRLIPLSELERFLADELA
jgi:excisionase family DNA binding protein